MNIFLRHGEVKNPKNILYYDIPGYELSATGKEQAAKAAKYIYENFDIKKIITSPLLRARQTSEIVNTILKKQILISNKITEWAGLVNWKGYTFDEITSTDEYKIYNQDPIKIKSNESFLETFKRVNELYESHEHTLFVTHQDTIRSFMFYKLGSQDFNEDKPDHCDLQYIVDQELKIYTISV